jgi:DNA-binding MarR family transcriptional regulator
VAQSTAKPTLTDGDYARLLSVRTRLRVFERWSAERAAEFGLTAAQHQLLLAVRGHSDERGPTIGEVADYLLLKHHSTVELANRTQDLGLIKRVGDPDDHRVVRLTLTAEGRRVLRSLSTSHLEELRRLTSTLSGALTDLKAR